MARPPSRPARCPASGASSSAGRRCPPASPRTSICVRASCSTAKPASVKRRRHVPLVVVVAEHGKDAEGSGQPGERLGRRLDEPVIAVGHVVAADDDEVGLVGHDEVDRAGDHLVGDRRAAMKIGEEADAKAGKRRRASRRRRASARSPRCGGARRGTRGPRCPPPCPSATAPSPCSSVRRDSRADSSNGEGMPQC